LASAETLLAVDHLLNADSCSLSKCAKPSGELIVVALCKLYKAGDASVPFASKLHLGKLCPSKAKFFGCLLVQARIQSRAALLKKKFLTTAEAVCPICSAANGDASPDARLPNVSGAQSVHGSSLMRMSNACMSSPAWLPGGIRRPSLSYAAGTSGNTKTMSPSVVTVPASGAY
jgi:hypothetical protein